MQRLLMTFFCFLGVLLCPVEPLPAMAGEGKELSLPEAIHLALDQNPKVRQARKGVAAAMGVTLQARAIPRLEFSTAWT